MSRRWGAVLLAPKRLVRQMQLLKLLIWANFFRASQLSQKMPFVLYGLHGCAAAGLASKSIFRTLVRQVRHPRQAKLALVAILTLPLVPCEFFNTLTTEANFYISVGPLR